MKIKELLLPEANIERLLNVQILSCGLISLAANQIRKSIYADPQSPEALVNAAGFFADFIYSSAMTAVGWRGYLQDEPIEEREDIFRNDIRGALLFGASVSLIYAAIELGTEKPDSIDILAFTAGANLNLAGVLVQGLKERVVSRFRPTS